MGTNSDSYSKSYKTNQSFNFKIILNKNFQVNQSTILSLRSLRIAYYSPKFSAIASDDSKRKKIRFILNILKSLNKRNDCHVINFFFRDLP